MLIGLLLLMLPFLSLSETIIPQIEITNTPSAGTVFSHNSEVTIQFKVLDVNALPDEIQIRAFGEGISNNNTYVTSSSFIFRLGNNDEYALPDGCFDFYSSATLTYTRGNNELNFTLNARIREKNESDIIRKIEFGTIYIYHESWNLVDVSKYIGMKYVVNDNCAIGLHTFIIITEAIFPTDLNYGFTEEKQCLTCGLYVEKRAIPTLNQMATMRLPFSLDKIEEEAFENLACQAIIIPEGCTTIGEHAFAECANLLYVKIPASVKSYPANTFDGCNENLVIDWEGH